jgi:hypothetical protein
MRLVPSHRLCNSNRWKCAISSARGAGNERSAVFSHGSENGATPADEVPQDRDDRDEQKEMNQSSCHVENAEPEEPGNDQNDRQGD